MSPEYKWISLLFSEQKPATSQYRLGLKNILGFVVIFLGCCKVLALIVKKECIRRHSMLGDQGVQVGLRAASGLYQAWCQIQMGCNNPKAGLLLRGGCVMAMQC